MTQAGITQSLPWLEPGDPFPDVKSAWGPNSPASGLLAVGGDLEPDTLLRAYRDGIFPWFSEGEPLLWWFTSPRMVLQTDRFKLSTSLRKQMQVEIRRNEIRVTFDAAFPSVIHACASAQRPGQRGTWITPAMQMAYIQLHHRGVAHSIEIWWKEQLIGGLYGLLIGRMVYGESMFSLRSNASKMALAALVAFCKANTLPAIDCQQVTQHLQSMGATPMGREEFQGVLRGLIDQPSPTWQFDPAHLDRLFAQART